MSEYHVKTASDRFGGTAVLPGSKSITNRALLLAAMAEGRSVINGVLFSDDTRAFLQCLRDLGYPMEVDEKNCRVTITGGKPVPGSRIYVNSAGTAARFLAAFLSSQDAGFYVDASEQMKRRPMKPLLDALRGLGAEISYPEKEGYLPFRIHGCSRGGKIAIDGTLSSQFVSALLMSGSRFRNGLILEVQGKETAKSYIEMTKRMMGEFGGTVIQEGNRYTMPGGDRYQARVYNVEPDISGACYFIAAAVLTGCEIFLPGVFRDSMQGDIRFLDVAQKLGAVVMEEENGIRVTGPAGGKYPGIDLDMNDFSDQVMTMAALAVFADSPTTIRNISHIKNQESDRVAAVLAELTRLGIACHETEDGIQIIPGEVKPAVIQTYSDHRMAMAFALAGLRREGIVIADPECVSKTFENYFEVLESLYG